MKLNACFGLKTRLCSLEEHKVKKSTKQVHLTHVSRNYTAPYDRRNNTNGCTVFIQTMKTLQLILLMKAAVYHTIPLLARISLQWMRISDKGIQKNKLSYLWDRVCSKSSGAGKFCLAHGPRQLTRDIKSDVRTLHK